MYRRLEDKKSDEFVEAIFIIRIVIPTGESMEVQVCNTYPHIFGIVLL